MQMAELRDMLHKADPAAPIKGRMRGGVFCLLVKPTNNVTKEAVVKAAVDANLTVYDEGIVVTVCIGED